MHMHAENVHVYVHLLHYAVTWLGHAKVGSLIWASGCLTQPGKRIGTRWLCVATLVRARWPIRLKRRSQSPRFIVVAATIRETRGGFCREHVESMLNHASLAVKLASISEERSPLLPPPLPTLSLSLFLCSSLSSAWHLSGEGFACAVRDARTWIASE